MLNTPADIEARRNLAELRRPALEGICTAAVIAGFVWTGGSAVWAEQVGNLKLVLAPFILLISALAALVASRSSLGVRSGLLLAGLTFAFAPCLSSRSSIAWLYMPCVPITVAGLIIGPGAAFMFALSLSAGMLVAVRLEALPWGFGDLAAPLSVIWITALTAWFSTRGLYTALEWAMNSQRAAWQAANQARQRREELRRTVDSLNRTHGLLERSLQELDLVRIEAERSKQLRTEFAANISHELRTPLNIILGFTEIMTRSPEVYGDFGWPPTLHRDVFEIRRNARYLSKFVDDILDLARLDAMRMPMNRRPSDLASLVEDSIDLVGRLVQGKPVGLQIDIPDDLPQVPLDELRIRQVLLNLLINACRFTERGSITVRARASEREVTICVSDTGRGIPQDRLERIFDKFEQAGAWRRPEQTGKGLGLALAKELVALHGGSIWAESTEGQGSSFYFTLPLAQTTIGRLTGTARPRRSIREEPPHLLIVDEDSLSAKYLQRQLEGYEITRVADIEQARALVADLHPRSVIVNVPPGSQDGRQPILPRIPGVPIIACSLPSWRWLIESKRVAACLAKPISSAILMETIEELAPIGDILVVDDDKGFIQFVRRSFETRGQAARMYAAYDGLEAVEKAREILPAMILLDVILPKADGFAVIDELQADPTLAAIPVVLVTGASLSENGVRFRGGQMHMVQPEGFTEEQTVQLLKSALLVASPNYHLTGSSGPEQR